MGECQCQYECVWLCARRSEALRACALEWENETARPEWVRQICAYTEVAGIVLCNDVDIAAIHTHTHTVSMVCALRVFATIVAEISFMSRKYQPYIYDYHDDGPRTIQGENTSMYNAHTDTDAYTQRCFIYSYLERVRFHCGTSWSANKYYIFRNWSKYIRGLCTSTVDGSESRIAAAPPPTTMIVQNLIKRMKTAPQ